MHPPGLSHPAAGITGRAPPRGSRGSLQGRGSAGNASPRQPEPGAAGRALHATEEGSPPHVQGVPSRVLKTSLTSTGTAREKRHEPEPTRLHTGTPGPSLSPPSSFLFIPPFIYRVASKTVEPQCSHRKGKESENKVDVFLDFFKARLHAG